MSSTPHSVTGWWRDAVVYQLYIRSFADADGDGTGDIGGVRARLDHLVGLGLDALWVNPWYPSPQVDSGYDVADFRDIDPLYGSLDDADALVRDAHAPPSRTGTGIRLISPRFRLSTAISDSTDR